MDSQLYTTEDAMRLIQLGGTDRFHQDVKRYGPDNVAQETADYWRSEWATRSARHRAPATAFAAYWQAVADAYNRSR